MKKKINICLEDEKSFFEIRSFIAQIRLEKTEKQIKIFRATGWFLIATLFVLLGFLETNKDNIIFVFFPVILLSFFSGFVYLCSFLFSIIPAKRVRRDFVKNFELLISASRCFFVKITIDDYKESLIYKIRKEMRELDKKILLAEEEVKRSQDKISLLLDDEESSEILGDKITSNRSKISHLTEEKERYMEIIRQIME